MLYIDAIVYNYSLPQQNEQPILSFRSWPLEKLQSELKSLRSDADQFLDWQNPVRLTRALEYYALTGGWIWEEKKKNESKYPYILLGLQVEKATLKRLITERVENQVQRGLIDEVRTLLHKYPQATTAMTGIGYRQVASYLKGEYSLTEMKTQIIHDTLAYAKRQMTWWRRNREITWLPVID
jgi:tRNA dimethylallyltransferase